MNKGVRQCQMFFSAFNIAPQEQHNTYSHTICLHKTTILHPTHAIVPAASVKRQERKKYLTLRTPFLLKSHRIFAMVGGRKLQTIQQKYPPTNFHQMFHPWIDTYIRISDLY